MIRVVYIAGPFRDVTPWAVEQHVRVAEALSFLVASVGAMPLCPHTNTRFSHGTLTEQFWLDGTLELMSRCDAVILTPDWQTSEGARAEVVKARQLNIPVFETIDALRTWLRAPILPS